ncbi:MAG: hypothetical protein GC203_13465 [Phenylobacterium sp.]|uniref:hypothetical protein n=1 Tax=Phenylobacterium sp. TaxID=1871053 RepID=UPI0025EB65CB|nr:hypothetical protein [Phenylobacterium sp.]MBI1198864.1 hypothetical protein [Phenylobacterium sp.]
MEYRFVALDSSGKAMRSEDWRCASDAEAMERAVRERPSFGAEVWRGGMRLGAVAGPLSRRPFGGDG